MWAIKFTFSVSWLQFLFYEDWSSQICQPFSAGIDFDVIIPALKGFKFQLFTWMLLMVKGKRIYCVITSIHNTDKQIMSIYDD